MVIPLVMLVSGYIMKKHPPKKINGTVGYRTLKSMRNQETWDFAHQLCGAIWIKVGAIMMLLSFGLFLFTGRLSENTVGMILLLTVLLQTGILLISIIPVEKALGKLFDKKGNRIG